MENFLMKLKDHLKDMNDLITAYQESSVSQQEPIEKEIYEPITSEQAEEILYICRDYPDMLQDMLDKLRLEGIEYMPKKDYRKHVERLKKIVDMRKNVI